MSINVQLAIALLLIMGLMAPPSTVADSHGTTEPTTDESIFNGNWHANLRLRYEFVDQDGRHDAHAPTARLRLGYTTPIFNGLSAMAESEMTVPFDDDTYNAAGLNGEGSHAVIADPESYELNQVYGKYAQDGLTLIGGRQRIILDDARFIGNVGWRQNEQTFDAATIKYGGIESWELVYGYSWDVRRIFGDEGRDASRDFDNADIHMINFSYNGWDIGKVTGFAYLVDFESPPAAWKNSPGLSNDTYGIRLVGKKALENEVAVKYVL